MRSDFITSLLPSGAPHTWSIDSATSWLGGQTDVTREAEFDAWGQKLTSYTALASPKHGFDGAEADAAVGTYSFGARTYDPTLRRWVSPDPLIVAAPELDAGVGHNLNLYAFAGNNPASAVDLTGFEEQSVKELATAAVGFGLGVAQGVLPFGMATAPSFTQAGKGLEHSGAFQTANGAGQVVGGWISIGTGVPQAAAGTSVEAGSGGTLTIVAAPGAIVGAVRAANGAVAVSVGGKNIEEGKGQAAQS